MRVILIRPDYPYLVQSNSYGPLGIGYIVAYVKKHLPNIDIDICDMAVGEHPDKADLYGWTSSSSDYSRVVKLAYKLQKKFPDAKHVLGGPHATIFKDLCDPIFENVFVGEGEKSFVSFLKRGCRGERVVFPEIIESLDDIEFPIRKRLEDKQLVSGTDNSVTMMAARGCPFDCSFCSSHAMWGRKTRCRSTDNIISEIKMISNKWDIDNIAFIDDTMTINKLWLKDLCFKMKGMNIKWRALSRVDNVDRNTLENMRDAGCSELCFGVESFDPQVLNYLNKGTTPVQIMNAIRLTKDVGIKTRIFMMISTPGESPETIRINKSAIHSIHDYIDFMSLSTFMPFPGTDIWNKPEKYKIKIIDKNLDHMNQYQIGVSGDHPIWSPILIEGMTREDQLFNIKSMREFWKSLSYANRGKPR